MDAAYRLFVDVMERGRAAQDDWLEFWECDIDDVFFFEDILDDTIVWHDNMYGEYWGIDWDRVDPLPAQHRLVGSPTMPRKPGSSCWPT